MHKIDRSNQRYGKLLVIDFNSTINKKNFWNCICDCGTKIVCDGQQLASGHKKSCGCIKHKNIKAGEKIGVLSILSEEGQDKHGNYLFKVKCYCGQEFITNRTRLINKETQSCGCLKRKDHIGEISKQFWSNIVRSAHSRGHKVLITPQYAWDLFIKQNRKCAISGLDINLPIHYKEIKNHTYTASLDRIDSSRNYTEDNIQWLHKEVNLMKLDHQQEYFVNLCKTIAKHQENNNE